MAKETLDVTLSQVRRSGWATFPFCGDLLRLGASLGTVLRQGHEPYVQRLIPTSPEKSRKNSFSAIHGMNEFPFHTDVAHWSTPARILILRAMVDKTATPTHLLDSWILPRSSSQAKSWRRSTWRIRGGKSALACSMIFGASARLNFRWDLRSMDPIGCDTQQIRAEVLERIQAHSGQDTICVDWERPNQVLIVDNWRMLHRRPAVPTSEGLRILERVLVDDKGQLL